MKIFPSVFLSGIINRCFAVVLAIILCSCGGGGNDESAPSATPAPSATAPVPNSGAGNANADATASLTYLAGGTVVVADPASPIVGTKVLIAPGSLGADSEDITIKYEDALPGAFNAEAMAAGAVQASKTIVLSRTSGTTLALPAEVTIPYDKSVVKDSEVPVVVFWNNSTSSYSPVAVKSIDRTAGTITFFTAHFSKYVVAILKKISDVTGLTVPSYDTGFTPGADGFFDHNFGAYDSPGGSCFGMANYAGWYYTNKKSLKKSGLGSLYKEGDPVAEEDDQAARELISRAFMKSSQYWGQTQFAQMTSQGGKWTGNYMIQSLIIEKAPQTLLLGNTAGEHAATVYKYDNTKGWFEIYDNNFPGEIVTLEWNPITGFGKYSKYNGAYKNFAFDSKHSSFQDSDFEELFQGAEAGWSASKFAKISVSQPLLSTASTSASPTYEVSSDINVTIAGKVPHILGEKNPGAPRYAFLYYAGKTTPAAVVPVSASDDFTFTVAKLPFATNNDVIILVSQDSRNWRIGLIAFKQIQIKVTGQSFFSNFGFEKGTFDGWFSERHLWSGAGVVVPSDKSAIVSSAFDPIATDLSLVRFGKFAARINNSQPNYPISSVTQTATLSKAVKPVLRFHWSAVLEDPSHNPNEQPYVDISVYDKTKGVYLYQKRYYSNDPNYSGWKSYQGGQWKSIPWQVVELDLAKYVGDEITIKVEAAACALGAHGGYAYLDGEE